MKRQSDYLYPKKVKPLPYYGGKSGKGKSDWIASLLPWDKNSTFIVPYGGQAGVLLRRNPVDCEIYNDLDNRLSNWWEVLQSNKDELGHRIEYTPHSEYEYKKACKIIDNLDADPVDRAVSFYVICIQSFAQNLSSFTWGCRYKDSGAQKSGRWKKERVNDLNERFWNVQIFNRPAEKILDKVSGMEHVVIYVDPPYYTASTKPYFVCELDVNNLSVLLKKQKGKVALSGYGSEWDHLGWSRYELKAKASYRPNTKSKERVEVLWTNYDAHVYGAAYQEDVFDQLSLF